MDEKFRESMMEVYNHHKERVLEAGDHDEINKATADWQKAAELILKFDTASDTHDENIEKILNAQSNEEIRRGDDLMMDEVRIKADAKKFKIEFWKDIGKTVLGIGVYVGVTALAFYFDGKGVIFTSTAGRQVVPSAAKKLTDSFKF